MSDDPLYQSWLSSQACDAESLCRNCGACCGAFEDPCEHLAAGPDGKFLCKIYPTRLGPQKTVTGHTFTCVLIREKAGETWPGHERCGYKRTSKIC